MLKAGRQVCVLVGAILALTLLTQAKSDDRLALGNSAISHVPGSVMIFGGVGAGSENLGTIMFQPWRLEPGFLDDSGFAGVAMSRQLVRFWQHFWLEAEMGAGFRFEPAEDYYNPELWGAIYLKFDGFPWNDTLRTAVGVSTDLNWVRELVPSETVMASSRCRTAPCCSTICRRNWPSHCRKHPKMNWFSGCITGQPDTVFSGARRRGRTC